jgi:hypothetical protein
MAISSGLQPILSFANKVFAPSPLGAFKIAATACGYSSSAAACKDKSTLMSAPSRIARSISIWHKKRGSGVGLGFGLGLSYGIHMDVTTTRLDGSVQSSF